MSVSESSIIQVVGDARGRLLDRIVRSDRPHSIREWARRADVNHSHAQSLLETFERLGLVRSSRVGRSIMYQGVPQSALRKRLLGLLKVPDDVIDAARSSAQDAPAGVTAILFGSVAQGAQNQYSDMDICIIAPSGTHVEDWVNQYVAGLHNITPLPVNLLRYTPEEWSAAIDIDELVVQDIIHTGLRLTPASS